MCGRFTQLFTWRQAQKTFELDGPEVSLHPRYNLAPSQQAAVVRGHVGGRQLDRLRWGLIPSWAKEPDIGYKLINARAETVATKPSFRDAYVSRRCLIPADGFYEWRREGAVRQPWWIGRQDGKLMALAGLWESWRVPDDRALRGALAEYRLGDVVETFTILTTEARPPVRAIHPRMPAIVPPERFSSWLAGEAIPFSTVSNHRFRMYPVSSRVNNPRNDDPAILTSAGRS